MYYTNVKRKIHVRRLIVTGTCIAGLLLAAIGMAVVGNDYRFTQVPVHIPVTDGHLEGVLTTPPKDPARGLVVMVHGDSAVDATQNELYSPWFEGAADAGYATLSWSKPGVGGSTGNWLDQSMGDRATEVSSAIDWAITQSGIPTENLVLWGASQAGWVMPKVVAQRDDIDGVIAVGTAMNWLSQGRFNTLAELDYANAPDEERQRELSSSDTIRDLLQQHGSHEEYLDATTEKTPMSSGRWGFVARNFQADATEDLLASAPRNVPILLLAGDHDRNVDIDETEKVYREIFADDLTVKRFDAVHSLARPIIDSNTLVGTATGIFWPRALLASGVISSYTDFLDALG